ncbi:unnamed protein product [Adineta steineri]|uniref:Dynein regulatory complex protein 9 n=1 Tax=Adineta steineri TaxID=433720 RepID=A0A818Y348_9BILA|nr:unnamed protein product [Adineta steineri]
MDFPTESHGSSLTSQWFDYTPEMNTILNAFHQRIFNLEIPLHRNSKVLNHSQTEIKDNLSDQTMNTQQQNPLSPQSSHRSLIVEHYPENATLEKQFNKPNLSFPASSDQTTLDNHNLLNSSLHTDNVQISSSEIPVLFPLHLTPNQMKIRAYEYAIIFEDAFDQLNIIHNALSITSFNRNNNQFQLDNINSSHISDCSPFALNLLSTIEYDKFHYEIEYFFHILMLLFRTLLLEFQINVQTSITNIYNQLPSRQLIELNNRIKISQDKIRNLLFIKKHFHTEKSQQLNRINFNKSQLNDHLMEEKYRSKIALRYSNDWKQNHILQWIQMLSYIEENSQKTIDQYETIIKQTEISHKETIHILVKQNNEMKQNVNKWYEYYQNETYRFERELIHFRNEFNQIKRQRQDMYEEYERMKIIVDEYNQMKINERLILEKEKEKEEAIKRIQAWWRGTMIRHIKQKRRKKKKS